MKPSGSSSAPRRAQGHPGLGALLQRLWLQHCRAILPNTWDSEGHSYTLFVLGHWGAQRLLRETFTPESAEESRQVVPGPRKESPGAPWGCCPHRQAPQSQRTAGCTSTARRLLLSVSRPNPAGPRDGAAHGHLRVPAKAGSSSGPTGSSDLKPHWPGPPWAAQGP